MTEETHFSNEELISSTGEKPMPSYGALKEIYRSGGIPKINNYEMELLKFCNSVDIMKFLREEFQKNPSPVEKLSIEDYDREVL